MAYDPALVGTMRGYRDLHWFLNNGLPKKDKHLENNTRVRFEGKDCDIVISLHENDIITLKADGTIKIDTCGWATNTTIHRINDYLPIGFSAQRRKGVFYINWPNGQDILEREVTFYKREDGTYSACFNHMNTNEPKLVADLRNKISEYARKYSEAMEFGTIYDKDVDCEDCKKMVAMKSERNTVSSKHILDHIDRGEFPHTIALKACELFKVSAQEQHAVDTMLDGRSVGEDLYGRKRYIRSIILKYLLKQFNLPF